MILSVAAIAGLTVTGHAQGVIAFNGSPKFQPVPRGHQQRESVSHRCAGYHPGTSMPELALRHLAGKRLDPGHHTLLLSTSNHGTSAAIGQTLSAALDVSVYHTGVLSDPNGWELRHSQYSGPEWRVTSWWKGGPANYGSYAEAVASGTAAVGQTAEFSEILEAPLQIPHWHRQYAGPGPGHPRAILAPDGRCRHWLDAGLRLSEDHQSQLSMGKSRLGLTTVASGSDRRIMSSKQAGCENHNQSLAEHMKTIILSITALTGFATC